MMHKTADSANLRRALRPHCERRVRPHIRVVRVFEFYMLSSKGNPSFSTLRACLRRDNTLTNSSE